MKIFWKSICFNKTGRTLQFRLSIISVASWKRMESSDFSHRMTSWEIKFFKKFENKNIRIRKFSIHFLGPKSLVAVNEVFIFSLLKLLIWYSKFISSSRFPYSFLISFLWITYMSYVCVEDVKYTIMGIPSGAVIARHYRTASRRTYHVHSVSSTVVWFSTYGGKMTASQVFFILEIFFVSWIPIPTWIHSCHFIFRWFFLAIISLQIECVSVGRWFSHNSYWRSNWRNLCNIN